jgi:pullulanase
VSEVQGRRVVTPRGLDTAQAAGKLFNRIDSRVLLGTLHHLLTGLQTMNINKLIACLGAVLVSVAGVNTHAKSAAVAPRVAAQLDPAEHGADRLLVLHYHRPDGNYDGWNLWAWHEQAEGSEVRFDHPSPFGRYAIVPLGADGVENVGFIIRRGNWEQKDHDADRYAAIADDTITERWAVSGDPKLYTDPKEIDLSPRIAAAFLDAPDAMTIASTARLTPEQLSAATVLVNGEPGGYDIRRVQRASHAVAGRMIYEATLGRSVAIDDLDDLTIRIPGIQPQRVYARDALNDPAFTALDAELGPRYTPSSTTFTTWSPVADAIVLHLFDRPTDPQPARSVPLTRDDRGVWTATVPGDLHGTAYQFEVEAYDDTRRVADIHAFAATPDSGRTVVIDLDRTDPDGWGQTPPPTLAQPTDEILYEIHVRDFSIRNPAVPEPHRGKYLGLVHPGDAASASGVDATGLSHLLDLGITAVHLLPIQDFGNERHAYNWGYWTSLFNVAEGDYATDPHDPTSAPAELKQAILGLHRSGVRVVLDVVYNHTSSSGKWSPFDNTVPYYYFRTTPDGRLRNDAGVGNSIADERPMVRKYILDSLKYWTREYKVDGFRFDLVGTHTPETVAAITDELTALRPDITLYGEPWTGGGPIQFGKGAQRGSRFAVFNDHLRNAIRGDLDGDGTGFATGPGGDRQGVRRGVAGAIDDFANQPIETINYVSAHDNLTLWDKITRVAGDRPEAVRRDMHKLAHGIVLTSQGIAFIHGGADYARTKFGNHNSYNAGDDINAFDWDRKRAFADVYAYVRGLIELRSEHPAFRQTDGTMIRRHLKWIDHDHLIAYELDGERLGDPWRSILVAYNGDATARRLDLPRGAWRQVVDHDRAGTQTLREVSRSIELPPFSMAVLHRP